MAAQTRSRLTGGEVAVIVIASLLVLVFVAMLVPRLTADPGAGPTGTDGATAPETSSPGPDPDGGEPAFFAMPSGNIACQIVPDAAACVIDDYSYEAVDAAGCEGEAGAHLRVSADGATMPCEPLVVAGEVAVLDYGQSQSAHGFTCESARSGVTCRHDATGQGFALARSAYELF